MGAVETADVGKDLDLAEDVVSPIGSFVSRCVLGGNGRKEAKMRCCEVIAGAGGRRSQIADQVWQRLRSVEG
jgi:hypothetical protein